MYVKQAEGVQTEQQHLLQKKEKDSAKKVEKKETEQKKQIEQAAAQVELSFQEKTEDVSRENERKAKQASQKREQEAKEMIRQSMPHTEPRYGIHEETNRIMIQLVDTQTDELVREFPSRKDLDRLAKTLELSGNLLDEKM